MCLGEPVNIYYIVMGISCLISSYLGWRFSKITPEVEALDWGHVRPWLTLVRLGAVVYFVIGVVLIIYGMGQPAANGFVEGVFLVCVLILFNLVVLFARARILTSIFNGARQSRNSHAYLDPNNSRMLKTIFFRKQHLASKTGDASAWAEYQ